MKTNLKTENKWKQSNLSVCQIDKLTTQSKGMFEVTSDCISF